MVNYFIYAKDFSGSTKGVKHYHNNGLKTMDQFKKNVEKIKEELLIVGEPPSESKTVYLHWGETCWEVEEDEARKAYEELNFNWMGAQPECIIKYLKEKYILNKDDNIKLMYIITDGMIDNDSANVCFESNEDMHYETVVFHVFNKYLRKINLSVAASFFKSRCLVYRNNKLYDSTDISKEYDYKNVNADNFLDEKYQLKSYIKLKFINNFQQDFNALREINKLKKLRARLFEELSSKLPVCSRNEKVNLETKDRNVFLREFVNTDWYKNLNSADYAGKVDIEKFISTLINYIVSDVKSYSFDALKFDTKFGKSVEKEQMVDMKFTAEQEIEFPATNKQ